MSFTAHPDPLQQGCGARVSNVAARRHAMYGAHPSLILEEVVEQLSDSLCGVAPALVAASQAEADLDDAGIVGTRARRSPRPALRGG